MAGILSNNGLLSKSESYMMGFFGFMFFSAHPYTRSVTRERDSRVQLLCEGGGQVMSCPFLDQSRYLIMSGDIANICLVTVDDQRSQKIHTVTNCVG